MKNTGITYTSAERSPVILPEMAELLPPLSAEQLDALEADLIKNGCYAPIIVNEDMVIIDGHNRQALCEKNDLPYTMAVFSFEDLLEAKQWALDTQKGRRNLEKWELGKIALKLKPEIEAKAKANMAAGGQNFRPSEAEEGSATLPNLPSVEKAVDTRKELAEAVGLGERTMGKVMQIDENAPDAIKEAAKAALDANDTHYPPGNGYPYALEAISKFEAEAHGLHYAPSEIILTVGATEALFASFSTILNPGDEVIIPTPAFGLYEALVQLQGGVPVSLPTEHNHFQIVPEELKAAITDRTKAIILTSPNNPTGCVYTKETLDAVHAILRDKPIFVLCDDVYRTLTYCEDYHSFAEYQDMRDRIIVVQSFSKPYAMTGWRLGYCMADAKLMDRIQVFHQYCVTSVPSFVQRACVTALETDTSDVVEIFRRRRDYVYQRLVDMGLDVEKPEGAFYMFVDIRKFGMDSNTFCTRMLKEGLVGVIPGIHFGTEGFMRLSYCYSDADLKEGLDRIEKFIKSL